MGREIPLRIQVEKRLNKTTSRKAGSRQESAQGSPNASPGSSRPASRVASRPGSRYASEAEDSDNEDDGSSISDDVVPEGEDRISWTQTLITNVLERKGSTADSRVAAMKFLSRAMRLHPEVAEAIQSSISDLLPALVTNIKRGDSLEQQIGIKTLALALLMAPDDDAYEVAFSSIKAICEDSEEEVTKSEALLTMAIIAVYGGADEAEMHEYLEFLVEITESDGERINAHDSAAAVASAMKAFAFIASYVDSLEDHGQTALDAFVEQLESSDPDVQTSAALNIALLFEAAARGSEEGEDEDNGKRHEPLNLRIDRKRLLVTMSEFARSSKSVSRASRTDVRATFNRVIKFLDLEEKGIKYTTIAGRRTSPDGGDDRVVVPSTYNGKLRAGGGVDLHVMEYSTMARVSMMKWALQSQYLAHYHQNKVVSETLGDLAAEDDPDDGYDLPDKKGSKRSKAKRGKGQKGGFLDAQD